MNIKHIKKELGINNADLAKMLGYSSEASYKNSSAKPRIENFLIELYALMKTKLGQTKAPPDGDSTTE